MLDTAVYDSPESTATAVTMAFTRHNLGQACGLVRAACVCADMKPRDVEDLLIAVSEIVANAICHAGGAGTITVRPDVNGLFVEVRDRGPGFADGRFVGQYSLADSAGGGLWLARTLTRDFRVVSSRLGVTVGMFAPRRSVFSPDTRRWRPIVGRADAPRVSAGT